MSRLPEAVDVLIVGAGPVGLAASILCSIHGLSHHVIERRATLHQHPQAHVMKTRTLEILRRWGLDQEVHAAGTPTALQRYTVWCSSLSGSEYGRIDLDGKKGDCPRFSRISPTWPANLSQNLFEPIVHRRALALNPEGISFGVAATGLDQDAEGVTVHVGTEDGSERSIRSRYLIGADGASSLIRHAMGVAMSGPPALAHFVAIHIRADLSSLIGRRPGVLYWVLSPDVAGVFIVHDMRQSQVFMAPYDPSVSAPRDFTPEVCRGLVRKALGDDTPFDIVSSGDWVMSAQVADAYRRGRVFIVGDAAHRFPPTGGLGLNTGYQDVNNLIWKLAHVLRGEAGDGLLDSYETECRPIAQRNCARSADNHARMATVQTLIGVSPDRGTYEASLNDLFGEDVSGRRELIQAAIDDQVRHFAWLDVEMAPEYRGGAFAPSALDLPALDREEGYAPTLNPGAGLPHFWLKDGQSSLDALTNGFTLFVHGDHQDEARRMLADWPLTRLVDIVAVAEAVDADSPVAGWRKLTGTHADTAVLVRPDGHILWTGRIGELGAALPDILRLGLDLTPMTASTDAALC